MSRWVWASMPPGSTYSPPASTTRPAAEAGMPGRTSLISSPSIRTSASCVCAAVTTFPPRLSVLAIASPFSGLSGPAVGAARGALFPALLGFSGFHLLHGDAAFHGADQGAEVAAHALLLVHEGHLQGGRGAAVALAVPVQ